MIIDTSAIVAILRLESETPTILKALDEAHQIFIAAPTYLELCMVMVGKKGSEGKLDVDYFLGNFEVKILNFSEEHARIAMNAFLKYGKGRHPAKLNFGDCMSYAMSKTELMPLLFKGDDFRLTDVDCAV